MLITFSGCVGSGKSTNAKKAYHRLAEGPEQPLYLRFRFLSWKRMTKQPRSLSQGAPGQRQRKKRRPTPPPEQKRTGTVRPLTFLKFAGYLVRIVNFRLFLRLRLARKTGICDRYFYDNLVHYDFSGRTGRLYLATLRRAIPKPDLAILLYAAPEQIIRRRRHYDPDYLRLICGQYDAIRSRFPNIVCIRSDRLDRLGGKLDKVLDDFVNGRQSGEHRPVTTTVD